LRAERLANTHVLGHAELAANTPRRFAEKATAQLSRSLASTR
jgi:hypothetical protein